MTSWFLRASSLRASALAIIVLLAAAPVLAQLKATLVASGFDRPVGFVQNPADPTMQVVVEQGGRVRVLKNGEVAAGDFLDLRADVVSGGEQGLLGLAVAPDYATSGRVFVCFTNRAGHSVIARFTRAAADPLRLDPASRFDFLWPGGERVIRQPFANHNGGHLAFGPDGFLYAGFGDGGSGDDPLGNAQNPRTLLGKLLRLDVAVSAGDPEGYDVPASNPFAGRQDVLGEIWAIGLRNPWRWNFDDPRYGGTGALVIADVGQDMWEEVDYAPASAGGRNYGWRNREGAHANVTTLPPFSTPLVEPIFEYSHNTGHSITGGFVYRGRGLGDAYRGRYFFGDFVTSRIWSVALAIDPVTREATAGSLVDHTGDLGAASVSPSSFGVDAAGELYLVSYTGAIYRIEPIAPVSGGSPPAEPDGNTSKRHATGETHGFAVPRPLAPASPSVQ
jgi:glucose/arabinose dehydrogenase